MINVLESALNAISSVYPSENIEIINKDISYNQGYAQTSETSEKTHAHIQPLSDSETQLYSQSTTDSTKLLKFYILAKKDNKILISKIDPKQSFIKWNNELYRIFSLNNRVLDGWVCCVGALVGVDNANN